MPCCNAQRQRLPRGIAGYVRRYGDARDNLLAETSPAWFAAAEPAEAMSVGRAVKAGVAIWAVTKVLDGLLGIAKKGGRR